MDIHLSNGDVRPGPRSPEERAADALPGAWMREAQLADRVEQAAAALRQAVESGDADAVAKAQRAYQLAQGRHQAAVGRVGALEAEASPIPVAGGRR